MTTVTQADRERAADHWIASHPDDASAAEIAGFILSGKYDDWTSPQAFAAHRTSSQVELLEALEGLKHRAWNVYQSNEFGDMDFENAVGKANLAISNARSNSMVSGRVRE